jgi:hypothetical protein
VSRRSHKLAKLLDSLGGCWSPSAHDRDRPP